MGGAYVNGLQSNPAYIVAFNPGAKSRCAAHGLSAPPSRPRNTPTSAMPVASFSTSTPPFAKLSHNGIQIYIV
jgi:hypothetical protein